MALCDIPLAGALFCGPGDVVRNIVEVVNFASDPLGAILVGLQQAVSDLSGVVLPAVSSALHPDLTVEWWLDIYRVSFGIAFVILLPIIVMVTLLGAGKSERSGVEALKGVFGYGPVFILGSMFGPLIGIVVSGATSALADELLRWGVGESATTFFSTFSKNVAEQNMAGQIGGVFVAMIMLFGLVLALIIVIVILIIQLATTYLTGAILPLALVWAINPRTRKVAKIVPMVWLGIIFMHPLLFLSLGACFMMVAGLGMTWPAGETDGFVVIINLATMLVAIALPIFTPMAIVKLFNKAMPLGSQGIHSDTPLMSSASSTPATAGSGRMLDSDSAGARSSSADAGVSSSGVGVSGTSGATTVNESAAGAASSGGTSGAASAAGARAGASASAAGAAGSGAAAGTGAAAGAGGGMAAAGAGATATGVGAGVGVPLLIGAAATGIGRKAAEMGTLAANQVVEAADGEQEGEL